MDLSLDGDDDEVLLTVDKDGPGAPDHETPWPPTCRFSWVHKIRCIKFVMPFI